MLKRIVNCLILLISFYFFIDYVSLFPTYSMIKPVINTKTYSNDYFSFEYPENWSYQDTDTLVWLYDENNACVATIYIVPGIYYPIGEDEETYNKVMGEPSKPREILELSHLEIDGYAADKLVMKTQVGRKNYIQIVYCFDYFPPVNILVLDRTKKIDFLMPQLDAMFYSFHFYD